MAHSIPLRQMCCQSCGWRRVWGPEEMLQQLRARGKMRRERKPDPTLVLQLMTDMLPQIGCPECRETELTWRELEDEGAGWGEGRACEVCRQPIPLERLEIFPDATRCARCQHTAAPPDEDDFCPRCGGMLRVESRRGAGVQRYQQSCGSCGYRS